MCPPLPPPCRAVAEGHQRSRQDVARIHLALEATARDSLGAAHDRIRQELYAKLDTVGGGGTGLGLV